MSIWKPRRLAAPSTLPELHRSGGFVQQVEAERRVNLAWAAAACGGLLAFLALGAWVDQADQELRAEALVQEQVTYLGGLWEGRRLERAQSQQRVLAAYQRGLQEGRNQAELQCAAKPRAAL